MHIRVPFLAVLIISIFQLTLYGIQNNNYSTKELNEVLNVDVDNITEISMTDFSGEKRHTKDPEQIRAFINYFEQFEYKRLMNDQTAYMPMKAMTVNLYADDEVELIIPYGKEAFISYKVYSIKNGTFE